MVVYLRGHEGRGIGLGHKIRAYSLQDDGHDTVDANIELGLPVDSREYGIGAQILVDLGVTTMRLHHQQPGRSTAGSTASGSRSPNGSPSRPSPNPENIEYLRTKRERMGHLLDGLDDLVARERSLADLWPISGRPVLYHHADVLELQSLRNDHR